LLVKRILISTANRLLIKCILTSSTDWLVINIFYRRDWLFIFVLFLWVIICNSLLFIFCFLHSLCKPCGGFL
jgi:hypothetical protein